MSNRVWHGMDTFGEAPMRVDVSRKGDRITTTVDGKVVHEGPAPGPIGAKVPARLQPKSGGKIGPLRLDLFLDSAFGGGGLTLAPLKPSAFLDELRDTCVNDPDPFRFAWLGVIDVRDTGNRALAEAQATRLQSARHAAAEREQRVHAEVEVTRACIRAKAAELRTEAAQEVPGPGDRFTSPAELLRLGERPLITADEGERSGWGAYDGD